MPRKPCYWTRKLELDLVEFVREREFIWKAFGNTNHHIQQKYKAYAEFAAILGRGFTDYKDNSSVQVKVEFQSDLEETDLQIRQRGQRTDRPRRRAIASKPKKTKNRCKKVLDELLIAMRPLATNGSTETNNYWFFSRHVTERLNCMSEENAAAARNEIMRLLDMVELT
ncbi:hypothetical protein MSG28_009046 [Choristoneura fumiferana]|uniref:Uncharacterized protein n=1 Tax=Choristoneura fumiferana TaxID=7141 RepID=A0ACC0KWL4_CHOFU|nr:hypothetical protein MSG28_009046 [Choristoneura fumiferana]